MPDGFTIIRPAAASSSRPAVASSAPEGFTIIRPAPATAPKPKPTAAGVGASLVGGLTKYVGGVADSVMQASPLASVGNMFQGAAGLASAMQGRGGATSPGGNPFSANSATAADHTHKPQNGWESAADTLGQNVLNVFVPGSAAARAANVLVPTVASEVAGRTAHAMGASPKTEARVRTAGQVVGAVGASGRIRFAPKPGVTPDDVAGNIFADRASADPAAMRSEAASMRASGVEPTLLDVTGQKGQRLVRAVGVTNDTAGEKLVNNAKSVVSSTKPAVMARSRTLPGGGRTAAQLADHLDEARSTEAQSTYDAPYAAPVELTDLNVIQALRDPEGASAINRAITAARARMDYKAVADLQALKVTANGPTGNGQVWPTTGRALDRVQIAFGNKGRMLSQNGANDIASGMFKRQEIINGLLDGVEGLKPARAAYRAKSQALDVLNKPGARKDPFSTDPTDYKAWVDGLSPEAKHANQVAIRQEILDTLGGQRASTVGSVDELATSAYARENLGHALGPEEAGHYLSNLTARLTQRGNAQFVSPNGGSRTAVLEHDMGRKLNGAVNAADVAHKVATGNVAGLAVKAAAWLKARGISDAQAQALADASVDPRRLDGVISAIERARGAKAAQQFLTFRGGLVGAARGTASGPSSPRR